MNTTQDSLIMQRWKVIQYELLPEWQAAHGNLTPKLEKLIHILDWVRIDEFVRWSWLGIGRRPHDRAALASAFVAKAVLGLKTTAALIERLSIDRALRRICGFEMWKKIPNEATFSRAFSEFAHGRLAERTHEALIKSHLGRALIGHISRDGTTIEAREKPVRKAKEPTQAVPPKRKRGRPKRGEIREPIEAKPTQLQRQLSQTLSQMLDELPKACDRGAKCNAQGYKNSWNGYKLHIDTADCGVLISAVLSSASMHDSQAAIPLTHITGNRVTYCYDLMDAAYCSEDIREHSRSLGHVPLIDHNPRRGEKKPFAPHEAQRYKERTQAERTNARLKDEFGARDLRVKGHTKVMAHLMFGILALTADQLMRLLL
jgi:hypothetical protein